ncbi:mitochondrial 37S ribosomal protein bS1m [Kwoniella pini CBS 10737]|uniref:Uncharacterized protein n=1 Tax=Kwoniella pini CBS 10737 TaxID=1296096 RepID=A0A1B9HU05_9TREE|nr:uncharacterized protein I206_07140 [Kwoniella pini CBS 10737]OCF46753.1 hypothetical protein I206_07140 [Kwoniella pini CBS 10737]
MSSSPFPQLLRRANISTYDPLITRIYTSTPSSKSQYNDWGLKFNLPIKKGPRYIKFNSLDAGPGINCDWRSGEREARFVQAWGTGKIRWQNDNEIMNYSLRTEKIYDNENNKHSDDYLTEQIENENSSDNQGNKEEEELIISNKEIWLKDIESMSLKEFENYLDLIRNKRKEFLNKRLNDLPNKIKDTLILPEDKTLIHLASTGKTTSQSIINLQTSLTCKELSSKNSNSKLHSKLHRTFGLNYSKKPTSTNDFLPNELIQKGRILNKVSRYDDSHSRAINNTRNSGGGNNLPWVVSLGGITGKTIQNKNNKITEINKNYTSLIEETDYKRLNNLSGIGNFKINRAEMSNQPPIILGLKDSNKLLLSSLNNRMGGKWRQSTANQPSSLDTFKFDIDLTINSIESNPETIPKEIGSKEWVGDESKLSKLNDWSFKYNFGGPKNDRKKGEALERLRIKEDREQTMERLNRLLGKYKIGGEKKTEQSSEQ